MTKLLNLLEEIFPDNKYLKRFSFFFACFILVSSVSGVVALANNLSKNNAKLANAWTHCERYAEQLPEEHPFKKNMDEYLMNEALIEYSNMAGIILDSSLEMLKYELGQADFTDTGIVSENINYKIDESLPNYYLFEENSSKSTKKITLHIDEEKTIKLYRNNEEISFKYNDKLDNYSMLDDNLNAIISMGFTKTYIDNPDIAVVYEDCLKDISKGKTKLVILYGTHKIECEIVVK